MLGMTAFLTAHPEVGPVADLLGAMAERLCRRFNDEADADWRWFEPTLTYDNALLPLALLRAYRFTKALTSRHDRDRVARFSGKRSAFGTIGWRLVGNAGWHTRGQRPAADSGRAADRRRGVRAEAFRGAYLAITGDRRYLGRMRESFAWFLGSNRLDAAVYDSATAGCRDGLGQGALNLNQGAESTAISFLLALIEMLELAGEGLPSTGTKTSPPRPDGDAPIEDQCPNQS